MPDDRPESARTRRPALSRWQIVGFLLLALLALVGIAWAFDWETGSGFWRGFMRIAFEIVTHLGK